MKKLLLVLAGVLVLSSCGGSSTEKIKREIPESGFAKIQYVDLEIYVPSLIAANRMVQNGLTIYYDSFFGSNINFYRVEGILGFKDSVKDELRKELETAGFSDVTFPIFQRYSISDVSVLRIEVKLKQNQLELPYNQTLLYTIISGYTYITTYTPVDAMTYAETDKIVKSIGKA